MRNIANSRLVFLLLALCAGAAAHGQEQPVEQRQQVKQNQRMLYLHVHRQDDETMLEDPAIANQVTDEQILPDSNEQNVQSRELTLDDLRHERFVPAPVPGQGMQFVPGRGYVAGNTEEATEPGMKVLAPTLGFQMTGGLSSGQNPGSIAQSTSAMNPSYGASPSEIDSDPYAQSPDPLLGLDPFHTRFHVTGIRSALAHRPPANPELPEPSPLEGALTEPSHQTTVGKIKAASASFEHSQAGFSRKTVCTFKVNPETVHDRAELERLSREGCLSKPASWHPKKLGENQN